LPICLRRGCFKEIFMLHRRLVLIVALLLMMASSLRAEMPVAGSLAKPPAKPASENPCLKYLPDDTYLLGNIDLKIIMAYLAKNPSIPGALIQRYALIAKALTGIDPEADVDYVTVFLTGSPEKEFTYLGAIYVWFTTGGI
jgi:hypothetical protein